MVFVRDMSFNEITALDVSTFYGLANLASLFASANSLSSLPDYLFRDQQYIKSM